MEAKGKNKVMPINLAAEERRSEIPWTLWNGQVRRERITESHSAAKTTGNING